MGRTKLWNDGERCASRFESEADGQLLVADENVRDAEDAGRVDRVSRGRRSRHSREARRLHPRARRGVRATADLLIARNALSLRTDHNLRGSFVSIFCFAHGPPITQLYASLLRACA